MYNIDIPKFPKIVDDEFRHFTMLRIDKFSEFQIRNGPYGMISDNDLSSGDIHFCSDKELSESDFLKGVSWIHDHAVEIRKRVLEAMVDFYWEMRELVIESLIDEDPDEVVPEITGPDDLVKLCGIVAIHIGGIDKGGIPLSGIEFGCHWEEEHGAGVRFNGLDVLASGDGAVAFCF